MCLKIFNFRKAVLTKDRRISFPEMFIQSPHASFHGDTGIMVLEGDNAGTEQEIQKTPLDIPTFANKLENSAVILHFLLHKAQLFLMSYRLEDRGGEAGKIVATQRSGGLCASIISTKSHLYHTLQPHKLNPASCSLDVADGTKKLSPNTMVGYLPSFPHLTFPFSCLKEEIKKERKKR